MAKAKTPKKSRKPKAKKVNVEKLGTAKLGKEALEEGAGIGIETDSKGNITGASITADPSDTHTGLLPDPDRDYSQFGEQAIIKGLVDQLEVDKVAVELGARIGDHFSNICALRDIGWECDFYDRNGSEHIHELHITAENILLHLPESIGVLSIDIDGNDYHVLKAILEASTYAAVVVVEFNPAIQGSKAIAYDPKHVFDQCQYFGASFDAMCKLLRAHGYKLQARTNINIIAARGEDFEDKSLSHTEFKSGWPTDRKNRKWVDV